MSDSRIPDEERRQESRRNLNLQVEYPGRHGYPIDVTESVSAGGLFIRSTQHHRVGEELALAISLPGFPDSLHVRGVVSRIREATATSPRGVALQFAEEEYEARLAEVMSPAERRDFNLVTGPYAVLAALPRIRLASTPTPLHKAERLSRALGGPEIWLKREDLSGFALGGSEVRKMEFIAGDALARGAKMLVCAAHPESPKARVMGAAAARLGLSGAVQVPVGSVSAPKKYSHLELLGTAIYESDRAPEDYVERLQSAAKEPYFVGEEQGWLGACGFMLASIELLAQLRRAGAQPEAVITAVRDAETMSGLVLAQRWLDCPYDVFGVRSERSESWCAERVATIASEVCFHLNLADTIPVDDILVSQRFDASSKEVDEAIGLMAKHEGIFLGPSDSGIAMAGLVERIRSGEFRKGQAVVLVHTGGPC